MVINFGTPLQRPSTVTIPGDADARFANAAELTLPADTQVLGPYFAQADRSGLGLTVTVRFRDNQTDDPTAIQLDSTALEDWLTGTTAQSPTSKTITDGNIVLTFAAPTDDGEALTCAHADLINAQTTGYSPLPLWAVILGTP